MIKSILSFILFIVTTTLLFSQQDIPQDYFVNPLDGQLVLAGSFGELRSNHFHSGLDLKTQRREGLPVYASAAGTVTRIKISHYGYGKAIYVTHPNGYTTVYGHLQKFCDEIEEFVKNAQYKKESFEIELFPKKGELEIGQGEILAYSGNTGSSGGPHLHFEIRDANERPMNPFLFGLTAKDTRKPTINELRAYPVGENASINQNANPVSVRLTQKPDGSYLAENLNAHGEIGFAIGTIDQQDLANNKNGIYAITTAVNGQENFEVTMDKFSFAETRYLNRMIDYSLYKDKRKRVQKLFIEKNNPLSIYTKQVDNGVLNIIDSLSYQYQINVRDYAGNNVIINVPITGKKGTITPADKSEIEDYVYSNQGYTYNDGKFEVYIPKGALYEDTFLNLKTEGDKLTLHEDLIPVHKNIAISYDLSSYNEEDRDKLYLGRIGYKGDVYYSNTRIKDNKLQISTRILGDYTIGKDTDSPIVKAVNITKGKWMSKYRYLKFEITDLTSGIKGYRATVNGKYILLEYDPKTKLLTHDFNDKVITDTENNLKLIVTDNVGNNTTFETTFFRKSAF
ncbi:peptidase M23-like protein [Dokdonia sp. Hel_I_63]|uniref:M23 family metallopeptidase n=1 Tax=unclassified Dokdonia TaxID=2615033 RepID=UPI00020A686C|nr:MULTISPECIES: M23 family metallopeptidase [unclassified Dokdonia]AEE20111.1 Peptidase M23 [Dokdonia sp. 4H-3-7-5]TVZ23635.1 peptidase M23-like protein [Dokdonia sp. Hel_I_63]